MVVTTAATFVIMVVMMVMVVSTAATFVIMVVMMVMVVVMAAAAAFVIMVVMMVMVEEFRNFCFLIECTHNCFFSKFIPWC